MLRLVPPAEPDAAEKVRARLRKRIRPDGMLQCNRCGGREVLTIESGVVVLNGKRKRGTVIEDSICAYCWKAGIRVSMLPDLKPI